MSKGTPIRGIRLSDELWEAVKERTEEEGTTPSEVIREILRQYVLEDEK